jgi:hypothetical protein
MAAASLRALVAKSEPVEERELESFTEWALMMNHEGDAGSLVAGPYACHDEQTAREYFRFRERVSGIDLVSRRVMRTKWEVAP